MPPKLICRSLPSITFLHCITLAEEWMWEQVLQLLPFASNDGEELAQLALAKPTLETLTAILQARGKASSFRLEHVVEQGAMERRSIAIRVVTNRDKLAAALLSRRGGVDLGIVKFCSSSTCEWSSWIVDWIYVSTGWDWCSLAAVVL